MSVEGDAWSADAAPPRGDDPRGDGPAVPPAEAGRPARVVALGVASAGGLRIEPVVELRVGAEGVEGDRYREGRGYWSSDRTSPLTLVATGEVAAASAALGGPLDPLALRRNVVVEAESLSHLVGRRFRIGDVLLEGERPCDPCRYLEELLGVPGLKAALRGRGGLRARVLEGGTIRSGDRVQDADGERTAAPRAVAETDEATPGGEDGQADEQVLQM